MHVSHHRVVFQTEADLPYTQEPLTYDQPVGQLDIVNDARWSTEFTSNSWTALAVWIVMLCVLQAISWPFVRHVFRRFPDRGWAFCRLVTLLVAGYAVWLLASLELIAFRVVWCAAALLGVAALSFLLRRSVFRPLPSDKIIRRGPDRFIIGAEAIFWGVFALFLLFRLLNPDSYHPNWGGEKPMEFAHINALLRSPHFPPIDPWYADGFLNYYYYGAYLIAFMLKLTGIPTEIGFNLAQPTFMALLASGAFSVAAALGYQVARSRTLSLLTGVAGVIMVSFAGNLLVAARLILALANDAPPFSSFVYWFWIPTRLIPFTEGQYTITEFPYFTGLYADLHAHVVALPMTVLVIGFGFALTLEWQSVSSIVTRSAERRVTVPRVLVHLGLLALVLGSLFPTNAWDVPIYAALTAVAVFMATKAIQPMATRLAVSVGLVTGLGLAAYLLVLPFTRHYVALFGELDTVREKTPLLSIQAHLGVFLLIVFFGLGARLTRRSRHDSTVFDPLILTPLLGTLLILRYLGVERSQQFRDIADALLVVFLVGVLLYACLRTVGTVPHTGGLPTGAVLRWLIATVGVIAAAALATGRPVLGLFLGLAGVASLTWLMMPDQGTKFIAAMVAAAMLVGAGLEIVYLVDDLSGGPHYRMNTVFKFYNGIWILLGLSCAGLIGHMVALASVSTHAPQTARTPSTTRRSAPALPPGATQRAPKALEIVPFSVGPERRAGQFSTWARIGLGVATLAIAASLAFPFFSTGVRLDQRFTPGREHWTLNAFDWMDYGTIPTQRGGTGIVPLRFDDDRAVIDWFNDEVAGTPVIAEASISQYLCGGSRISIGTGLPVVLGWYRHEQQQRYQTFLDQRRKDLRTLYTSADLDRKRDIIARYRIAYIVVGDLERDYVSNDCVATDASAGVAALGAMVGEELEVAFTSGETVVYRVIAPS